MINREEFDNIFNKQQKNMLAILKSLFRKSQHSYIRNNSECSYDVLSEVYMLMLEKFNYNDEEHVMNVFFKTAFNCLRPRSKYVRTMSRNYGKTDKVISDDDFSNYDSEDVSDIDVIKRQNEEYVIELWCSVGKREKILYDLYINKGLNTGNKLSEHLGVSTRSAHLMLYQMRYTLGHMILHPDESIDRVMKFYKKTN
jgi:hypothetical protein